jgi:hypothetical protein
MPGLAIALVFCDEADVSAGFFKSTRVGHMSVELA